MACWEELKEKLRAGVDVKNHEQRLALACAALANHRFQSIQGTVCASVKVGDLSFTQSDGQAARKELDVYKRQVYYRGFGDEMCQAMKKLCGKADVITPNLTEVLFLLGKKADLKAESQNLEQIRSYAKQLSQLGPKTVIITGVSQGEKIWNIGYSAKEDSFFEVSTQKTGEGYSGTGDILTSVCLLYTSRCV